MAPKKQSKWAQYTYIITPTMMAIGMPVAVALLHIPGLKGMLIGAAAGLVVGLLLENVLDKMLTK